MHAKQTQKGFALLMFMVVMIGLVFFGVSELLNSSVMQKGEQSKAENLKVLQQAKEALLGYAVNYVVSNKIDKMGKLPCPDVDPTLPAIILLEAGREGNQDNVCGSQGVNAIGYLPYKELGLGKLEDAASQCLWYAVSGDYKNSPAAGMLNWDSVGFLNVVDESGVKQHGASTDDFPVALIISPGASINKNRVSAPSLPNCKADHTLANYLEGGTMPAMADTLWSILNSSYLSAFENIAYNDQVIAIYKSEIWERIAKLGQLETNNVAPLGTLAETVTEQLAQCLSDYGNLVANANRTLPFAAP